MGVPRFFKLHQPKRFEYNPIYWDPEKEEREERIRRIKQEMGVEIDAKSTGTTITRGSFRQYKRNTKVRASRRSNIRLIIILAALFLLAYLIFYR